jgi:MoaA/NifB/PqqE/SkfB family radical SAM enzyme
MEITPETGSSRSGTLMLHLLGKCNLTCLHCYMDGSPRRTEQLPLTRVIETVAASAQLDIGVLYLTGGEPLLYPGLHPVLETAAQVPGLEITVCTNATLVTPRHVAALKAARARASISVDGEAPFHDHFRNLAGAFRATETGIRLLNESGVPITIISTISRANLASLPWLVEWAHKAGASQFRVQPLLRLGRAMDIVDQCLSQVQVERLVLQLSDLANLYRDQGLRCSIIGQNRAFLLKHPCGAYVCNGGGCHRHVAQEIKKIVVREDGTVLPEATNLDRSYAIGDFASAPLLDLVNGYFENGGYARFDQLCRSAYHEVLPAWKCVVVPWDQIIAERSRMALAQGRPDLVQSAASSCLA